MLKNTPNGKYDQNTYPVVYKEKYVGKTAPFYRSSYEKRIFYWCDHNDNVVQWSSEYLIIPYLFRLDGKQHKYYPDVVARIRTNDGIKTFVIEVKPLKQTMRPKPPKNKNAKALKRYKDEMVMFIKNEDKWSAASQYCKEHGYVFKIITENELFNK